MIINKFKIALLLTAVILIACPGNSESQKKPNTTVKWESFNTGLSKAIKEKKPVIIDFYADWCHWCKVMDRETFSNEEVVKLLSRDFIAIRLDMEKSETITYSGKTVSLNTFASMLGVRGLPTVVFMDKDGDLIDKVPGYIKPDIFIGILRYISEGCYKLQVSFADYLNKKAGCK